MEAIGKGILIMLLAIKSFSPTIGHRSPSTGSYVPDPSRKPIVRMAILPFENETSDPNATGRMMNTVLTYILQTQQFSVVDPFIVEQQLFDLKLRKPSQLTPKIAKDLKTNLGIEVVLIGNITAYQIDNSGGDTVPVIALSARLLDLDTMGIVWSNSMVRQGNDRAIMFDIGRIDTLSDLTHLVAHDLASSLGKEAQRALKGYAVRSVADAKAKPSGAAVAEAPRGNGPATSAPAVEEKPVDKPAETKTEETAVVAASPASTQARKNLPDLFPDIEGFQKNLPVVSSHALPFVDCSYRTQGGGLVLTRITDCGNEASCKALQETKTRTKLEPGPAINGFKILSDKTKQGEIVLSSVQGRYILDVYSGEGSADAMKTIAHEVLKTMSR